MQHFLNKIVLFSILSLNRFFAINYAAIFKGIVSFVLSRLQLFHTPVIILYNLTGFWIVFLVFFSL